MDIMNDFYDTACFIKELDLIISVDTAVVHLAGLLNKPVWLLSKYDAHWAWTPENKNTPWYSSVKIFTQSQPFEWDSVINQVYQELQLYRDNFGK